MPSYVDHPFKFNNIKLRKKNAFREQNKPQKKHEINTYICELCRNFLMFFLIAFTCLAFILVQMCYFILAQWF